MRITRRLPRREDLGDHIRARVLLPPRKLAFRLAGRTRFRHRYYSAELSHALRGRPPASDISDHLGLIFFFALQARPTLIVELGTRGGESTRALLAAAALSDSLLLSVDCDDRSHLDLPHAERWRFVQADDVDFARSVFVGWCADQGVEAVVDVLFVDTSHDYEHTVRELEAWEPFVGDRGMMLFHDTNMGAGIYARTDGRVDGSGWDNSRGVIRAIEEFLGRRYDESGFFYDTTERYVVVHFPYCNGLTVLQRKC